MRVSSSLRFFVVDAGRLVDADVCSPSSGPGRLEVVMQSLKVHVKKGRLVLDEPTDLPEHRGGGSRPRGPRVRSGGTRPAHQAIEDREDDIERGDHADGFEFIARLRAKPDAARR
jgi:hypothetical protein